MPSVRAPRPPVLRFVSYPIIPPSIIIPANRSGAIPFDSSPFASAHSCLAERMICLSRTKWSSPVLSTTLNHVPPPAVLSASTNIAFAP